MKTSIILLLIIGASQFSACDSTDPKSSLKDDPAQKNCIVQISLGGGVGLLDSQQDTEAALSCLTKENIVQGLGGASLFLQTASIGCLLIPEPSVSKVATVALQATGIAVGYIAWRAKSLPCNDVSSHQKIQDQLCTELQTIGIPCINSTLGFWNSRDTPAKATQQNPIVMNIKSMRFSYIQPSIESPSGNGLVQISFDTCIFVTPIGSDCDPNLVQQLPFAFDVKNPSKISGPGLDGKFLIVSQDGTKFGQSTFMVSGQLAMDPMKSAFEKAKLFEKVNLQ